MLIGFRGRITRTRWWLTYLGYAIYIAFFFGLADALNLIDADKFVMPVWALGAVVFVSATVRRLHDRNRGAVWLLAFFVLPAILLFSLFFVLSYELHAHRISGGFYVGCNVLLVTLANIPLWWGFVEIAFLRGTVGENRFGPDSLVRESVSK